LAEGHSFNDCTANLVLREIRRGGAKYTWTNRQLNPVLCVLDRVLVSTDWEAIFPLCTLQAETIICPDHSPLILDSGEDLRRRSPRFFFEKSWLHQVGFTEVVREKWRTFETLVVFFLALLMLGRDLTYANF
jgi:hypothetical protein